MIYLKKFFAGIIDRILIAVIFLIITMVSFGPYLSSGYIGRYSVLAFETQPNNYAYMTFNRTTSSSVSQGYKDLASLDQAERGVSSYAELDKYMTILFVIANLLYLSLAGGVFKSTIGECICGLRTVDNDGDVIDIVDFIKKSIILVVLLFVFVQIRDFLNTTYFAISLFYLIVNWLLIFIKKRSLLDLLSKTYVREKNKDVNIISA